jgi:hypothetical protein
MSTTHEISEVVPDRLCSGYLHRCHIGPGAVIRLGRTWSCTRCWRTNVSACENDGTYPDYVELYNNGRPDVNLGDWSPDDNVLNQPRKVCL